MDNRFESMEDLEILIVSLAGTIGLTYIDSPSIGIKIVFGFLVFVDVITSINVGKSLVSFIKGFKKNKKEDTLESENEKEYTLEMELDKEKTNTKAINYEIKNTKANVDYNIPDINEKSKVKQLTLKR